MFLPAIFEQKIEIVKPLEEILNTPQDKSKYTSIGIWFCLKKLIIFTLW